MPQITLPATHKTKPIPNTTGFSIGHNCPKCGCDDWKLPSPGVRNRTAIGNTTFICRPCYNSARSATPARAKYRKSDKAKASAAKTRKIYQDSGIKKSWTARRRTNIQDRCPNWLDGSQIVEIEFIYKNCPDGHHVYHIIPLLGKLVSGLHVPTNLQYLPTSANLSKGNKYDIN